MAEFFGHALKKIRESKKLSIDDASERTRIPVKIISLIEEGRLDEISSAFYTRTFVKTYAQFLGALEEESVKEFLGGSNKKDEQVIVLKGEEAPEKKILKYKNYAIGVVFVFFVFWMLSFSFGQVKKFVKNYGVKKNKIAKVEKKETKKKIKKKDKQKVVPPKPKKQEKTVVESKKSENVKKIEGIMLEIEARYNTWVQVRSDGRLLFRGILKKKESDSWIAKDKIELELGNAGGVNLKINGKESGVPGRRGEKKSIVITEDGIKK